MSLSSWYKWIGRCWHGGGFRTACCIRISPFLCILRGRNQSRLTPSLFRQWKKSGKGKLGKGKAKYVSSFTVSSRLITDDEIDLGQV